MTTPKMHIDRRKEYRYKSILALQQGIRDSADRSGVSTELACEKKITVLVKLNLAIQITIHTINMCNVYFTIQDLANAAMFLHLSNVYDQLDNLTGLHVYSFHTASSTHIILLSLLRIGDPPRNWLPIIFILAGVNQQMVGWKHTHKKNLNF